jgi:hypothetical protein
MLLYIKRLNSTAFMAAMAAMARVAATNMGRNILFLMDMGVLL